MIVEFIQAYPRWSIIIVGLLIAFFIQLINFLVLDKKAMRELKQKQKDIRAQMKEHKHDLEKQKQLSNELLAHSMASIKHSFKPMLITMVPALLALVFIKGVFSETSIASSWIWYYISAALVGGIVFRKLFKLP